MSKNKKQCPTCLGEGIEPTIWNWLGYSDEYDYHTDCRTCGGKGKVSKESADVTITPVYRPDGRVIHIGSITNGFDYVGMNVADKNTDVENFWVELSKHFFNDFILSRRENLSLSDKLSDIYKSRYESEWVSRWMSYHNDQMEPDQ